jgi:hypothetical protein
VFLDGTFPRTIGDDKIAYIPLTLGEEQEVDGDGERAVIRMLAKALKYRLDKGLDTPKSAGLDETKSIEENVRMMLGELPSSTRQTLILAIQADVSKRLQDTMQFFIVHREKYLKEDDGPKRGKTPLDSFVMFSNSFKETPYTLHDIANLTALQYQALTLSLYEANVRQANDHAAMSERIKSKAATGKGGSKRQLVGS